MLSSRPSNITLLYSPQRRHLYKCPIGLYRSYTCLSYKPANQEYLFSLPYKLELHNIWSQWNYFILSMNLKHTYVNYCIQAVKNIATMYLILFHFTTIPVSIFIRFEGPYIMCFLIHPHDGSRLPKFKVTSLHKYMTCMQWVVVTGVLQADLRPWRKGSVLPCRGSNSQ